MSDLGFVFNERLHCIESFAWSLPAAMFVLLGACCCFWGISSLWCAVIFNCMHWTDSLFFFLFIKERFVSLQEKKISVENSWRDYIQVLFASLSFL